MSETFLKLAEYGSVGVSLALILLVAYLLPKFINLIGNHMNHNTTMLTEVRDSVIKLNEAINKLIDKL